MQDPLLVIHCALAYTHGTAKVTDAHEITKSPHHASPGATTRWSSKLPDKGWTYLFGQLAGLRLNNLLRQGLCIGGDRVSRALAALLQLLCELVSHQDCLQLETSTP